MSLSLHNPEELVRKFDANRTMIESLVLREHGGSLLEYCITIMGNRLDAIHLMNKSLAHYFSSVPTHKFRGDILSSLKQYAEIIKDSNDLMR